MVGKNKNDGGNSEKKENFKKEKLFKNNADSKSLPFVKYRNFPYSLNLEVLFLFGFFDDGLCAA